MTLSELQLLIQQTSENYEETFTDNLNNFIKAAEERVNNTVQLLVLRSNVTRTITAGSLYVGLPADFLSPFSLAVITDSGQYTYLLNKDVNFIRAAYPQESVTGVPVAYAFFDDQTLILGPVPDDDYSLELHYYAKPISVTTLADDEESWLSKNFPYLLLYGALVEACIYMKGEKDILDMYKGRFEEQLALLKQLGDGKDRQDTYRAGQVRDKVQ